jgi:spermidine synthase
MTTLDAVARGAIAGGERLDRWTRGLCVLFFFSGFPALIYQLTWQRALFRIFGVNVESVTIVVAAFMLGLGLGSLGGGWLSRRRALPLLPLLATIEILTGAFGVASLAIFEQVGDFTAGWSLPAMAAVNLALVIVPTLLMGATLPVLVAHLVRRSGNVGSAVGLLYYVNTLGAGAACLACAALLFPFFGMRGAVHVAVLMNALVAIGALAAWRYDLAHPQVGRGDAAAQSPRKPALAFAPVLALAAVGGFVSLSYEIFFFRTVSFASGSSATAFAATLCAFLIGVASGSRQAGAACAASSHEDAIRSALRGLMIANLLGFVFLPVLAHLAWLGNSILAVALIMVFLVARAWGALLPYLAHLGIAADEDSGMRTALLYLANILGAATGTILIGFVLMDRIGLAEIAAGLVMAGLACALLLAAALPIPPREKCAHAGLALVVAVFAALLIPSLSTRVFETLQWKGAAEAKPFVKTIENRSGVITVDSTGAVYGNGMYDGRFNTDLRHDFNGILRPYALSLFHPGPRRVLMIGLSSGSWAQVIASNPEVESLTIVEINPGYMTLIAGEPEVASLLKNPKVTIITDDGRRWLRLNGDRKFDAIVSNTTWHFRANISNLLSGEFLAMVRDHLDAGGVFFYNTTDSSRVQRTACLAFADGARFTNHMVASMTPIAWDFARWRRVLESYRIDGVRQFDPAIDADAAFLDGLVALRENFTSSAPSAERPIEPCADILTRTAGEAPVTDDNMGSEWRYFLGLK